MFWPKRHHMMINKFNSSQSNEIFKTNHKANIVVIVMTLLLFHSSTLVNGEVFNSASSDDNLGTAYEFKIHVDAGKEDCYYQYVEAGSSLYIAFQVMRGGDGNAGFYVNGPTGQTILPYQWKQHAELDDSNVIQSGYYSLCIDNKPATFQAKLVSLYLASLKRDEWEKYIQELTDADGTANNATHHLRNVQLNINDMMKHLEHSKQQHSYDGYLSEANNRYVQNWSILQCIVIIACSIIQVIFVRKLFESNEFGKGKVRA